MTLKEIARNYKDEIMDGIAWVAIWKEGRSWNAEAFFLDFDSEMIKEEEMERAQEIVAADENAVFINEYYCAHMGDGTLEDIMAGIKFHYGNGYNLLSESTAYEAPKQKLTEEQAKRLIERLKPLQEDCEKKENGYIFPCPRCGHHRMERKAVRNAISRHADVYICSACGTDEAMRDMAGQTLPLTEWGMVK